MKVINWTEEFTITFRKLERNEKITRLCFHSLNDGATLFKLFNEDTVGKTPEDFSQDRSFWEPVSIRLNNE